MSNITVKDNFFLSLLVDPWHQSWNRDNIKGTKKVIEIFARVISTIVTTILVPLRIYLYCKYNVVDKTNKQTRPYRKKLTIQEAVKRYSQNCLDAGIILYKAYKKETIKIPDNQNTIIFQVLSSTGVLERDTNTFIPDDEITVNKKRYRLSAAINRPHGNHYTLLKRNLNNANKWTRISDNCISFIKSLRNINGEGKKITGLIYQIAEEDVAESPDVNFVGLPNFQSAAGTNACYINTAIQLIYQNQEIINRVEKSITDMKSKRKKLNSKILLGESLLNLINAMKRKGKEKADLTKSTAPSSQNSIWKRIKNLVARTVNPQLQNMSIAVSHEKFAQNLQDNQRWKNLTNDSGYGRQQDCMSVLSFIFDQLEIEDLKCTHRETRIYRPTDGSEDIKRAPREEKLDFPTINISKTGTVQDAINEQYCENPKKQYLSMNEWNAENDSFTEHSIEAILNGAL